MNQSKFRKRNKPSLNSREANLNGGSSPISPAKSSFTVSTAPATAPALPQTSSFAKTAGDILTPDMTDIEKLQKLKEWILADQHPYFTSAPKVAHLLSLHVSASASNANSNTSGSSGEQERPLSTIPLAERLSSPKTAHIAGASYQNTGKDEDPGSRRREEGPDDVSMNSADLKENQEDVEMSDSHYRETTGPLLTPTRSEPPHQLGQPRPEEPDRKPERYNDHQSLRNDGRGYADNQARGGNGRYEPRGRYRGGGGYNNQGNRRFSIDDREQTDQRFRDYSRDRDYDRRPEYSAAHPDDRRNVARSLGASPPKQGHQSYDGRSGEPARRGSANQFGQSLVIDTSAKSEEDAKPSAMDPSDNTADTSELNSSLPLADVKTEPPSPSPTSVGNGRPHSTTEFAATIPLAASPPRSEIPLDAPPGRLGQGERPTASRSPPASAGPRDVKIGRAASRDRDPRPNFNNRDADRYHHQDIRPRADSYQKFPTAPRPYERAVLPRDDTRSFSASREPHYRPGYALAPPVDDRRFVPREVGYSEEPGYGPRRDYRTGDWDNKRRDSDRPMDRPYDRDRDRDVRGPLIQPSDARGGPRIPHTGTVPPRGYPPERDAPRGLNARTAHDPYPPPLDSRGYDRDSYGAPLLPPTTPYLRAAPRVRPRSLSPPTRRDYRPEQQRPPAKRPRGPDDPYIMPPPLPAGGHYPHSNYGPPSGRGQDYAGDRRSIPSGPAQGAYYRPDDRPQGRY